MKKNESMEIDEHLFPTNATVKHLCMLKFYANCGKVSELETRDQLVQLPTPLLKEFTDCKFSFYDRHRIFISGHFLCGGTFVRSETFSFAQTAHLISTFTSSNHYELRVFHSKRNRFTFAEFSKFSSEVFKKVL